MKEEQLFYKAIEVNLAPPEHIYRRIVKERKTNPIPRRIALAAAACLAILITSALCIPEARAAVMGWLKPAVDPSVYISTPAEERTVVPIIDAAIEPIDEQAVTVTVVDAVDEEWKAWAEKLSVELGELLYDGEFLHITGMLKGNTSDFLKATDEYIRTEDENGISYSPPNDMVACNARYSLNGGNMQYNFFDVLPCGPRYRESEFVMERIAAGEVPFSVDLDVGEGLTGTQALTLDLIFTDIATLRRHPVMPEDTTQILDVALRISGLTFDATAGTAANNALPRPIPVSLLGDVKVFAYEENGDTATVGNDLLSLEGGTLSALMLQQRLTGTAIVVGVTLPNAWAEMQCATLGGRLRVDFIIDGQNQGGSGSAYTSIRWFDADTIHELNLEAPPDMTDPHNIVFSVETGLMPEDWEHIKSFDIVLCVEELTTYNHTKLPTDGRVSIAIDKNSWSEDSETKRFTDCPLKVK